jgi:hypothetical protein
VVDVFYRRSTDNGVTWDPELRLNDDGTQTDQWFPTISVGPTNSVVATWYDRRLDSFSNYMFDYYERFSSDAGLTWGSSIRVSDASSPVYIDPYLASCYHGDYDQQVQDADNVYIAWSDDRNVQDGHNDPDIWFERQHVICNDTDGDGYGDPASPACTYPGWDCDDTNPEVNTGASEGPDGDPTCSDTMDNDCDGDVDLADFNCIPCTDDDSDGYGNPASGNCTYPELDCDDTNPEVNPGAAEGPYDDPTCSDTLDNDCDSLVDLDDVGDCVEYYAEELIPQEFVGDGTAMGWQADDNSWLYTLPFTFPYFDTDYASVYVCSNGFLDFTNSAPDYWNSEAGFISRVMIAPLWDDLRTDGTGEDIYIHQPTPYSVAIQWFGSTYTGGNPVEVEVILYEDGIIQLNYGDGNTGLSPTIGISKGDGTWYYLSPYNGQSVLTHVDSDLYIPVSLECTDNDGDGYGDPGSLVCTYPGWDCDDTNPDVNPGAMEGPDGDPTCSDTLDNDCDNDVDLDDIDCIECIDNDSDGYGDPASGNCTYPWLDCDDSNPDVNPGVIEGPYGDPTCSDTLDNDCDDLIDMDDDECVCNDGDGDGYGDPASPLCTFPERDCDDSNPSVYPAAPEICDCIDNQCPGDPGHGQVDESGGGPCGCPPCSATAEASAFSASSADYSYDPLVLAYFLFPVVAIIWLGISRRKR